MAVKLIYLDDSGAQDTGWIVFGSIEVDIADWTRGLRAWLDWRKSLASRFQIPVLSELHASPLMGGRSNPSLDQAWNRSKANRHTLMREALEVVGDAPALSVGIRYRPTPCRKREYTKVKRDTYAALVGEIDARLLAEDDHGILIMDGDGSDRSYVGAHRGLKLATRRIIEDPVFQQSHVSQWVQMADFVAWVGYQHLYRHRGNKFAWQWYEDHLLASDPSSGPRSI